MVRTGSLQVLLAGSDWLRLRFGSAVLWLLLAMRGHHHDHVSPLLLWLELDVAELLHVLRESLEQPEPELGTRLLATAEHDRDLDLVARFQEPHDVTLLGLESCGSIFGRSFISLMTVCTWLRRASRAFC